MFGVNYLDYLDQFGANYDGRLSMWEREVDPHYWTARQVLSRFRSPFWQSPHNTRYLASAGQGADAVFLYCRR